MNAPRTAREALMAELLGDMDELLARVEALPGQVETSEQRLGQSVAALDAAADRFRVAVTAFTEQAKTELAEYLDRQASSAAEKTVSEQRAALEEAARAVFRSESAVLRNALAEVSGRLQQSVVRRVLGHGVTALVAGVLVYLIRR